MTEKKPSEAWRDARTAADKAPEKQGITDQLVAIEKEGRIPPDDADSEIRELFVETMKALETAALLD